MGLCVVGFILPALTDVKYFKDSFFSYSMPKKLKFSNAPASKASRMRADVALVMGNTGLP